MPRTSRHVIELTGEERAELERRAATVTLPFRVVQRARIVLYAADGMQDIDIAARLGAGCMRTRSSRGRHGHGSSRATRSSLRRPGARWTSTPVTSRAGGCGPKSMSSALMRRASCRCWAAARTPSRRAAGHPGPPGLTRSEIYFSIIQRKALTPNDFATLPELAVT